MSAQRPAVSPGRAGRPLAADADPEGGRRRASGAAAAPGLSSLSRRAVAGLVVAVVAGAGLWLGGGLQGTDGPTVPDPIALARASGKPVLVEFGAGTCYACREMKGVLADLKASHGDRMMILDIEFGTPEGRRVLRDYAMQAIPTQLFFAADGTELGRHLGAIPAAEILKRLGLNDG